MITAIVAPVLAACGDVSLKDEAEMGDTYAAEIRQQVRIINDPVAQATLNKLGNHLASRADSTDREYTFYLVDSPEVNAFAIPGGHIFVNRGLIESADEVSEFAGVLGHEIAHVTERHGIEQMKKRGRANILVTIVYVVLDRDPGQLERAAIEAGGAAVFAKYGREAESEADARAVRTLPAAGYDPEGVATFFEQMLADQKRQPGMLDKWFASHPTSQQRVVNARTLIRTLNVDRARLTDDTPEYQAFRARVRQLGSRPAPTR
ncbi:MAG TPA: M48 family metallopeptidase [Longimicrobium sp.]|jgi:predicted Zn-dependent protease|uniref:M48 family metallopeptidase n=1 Tax=Longimicrobium sp. TaxID=2029185 RepID=UPI002EDB5C00